MCTVMRSDSGRLTPTCVGRTGFGGLAELGLEAHPHVRGEDWAVRSFDLMTAGSPPRAWGGRHPATYTALQQRLTPTCVGRTAAPTRPSAGTTAHPHVRGEDGRYLVGNVM